jgi:drug/metabolite transporter (DMT)-like permease
LILISAALHATWNAAVKKSPDKLPIMVFIMAYGGLVFIPLGFFVPLPGNHIWPWIIGSAIVHLLYQISLTKMYETSPLSYAYPIARGTGPLLVAIFSFFILQETLQPLEFLFIFSLIAGIFLTIRSVNTHQNKQALTFLYPLLTGIMIAGYTLIDAHAVKSSENILSFIVWSGIVTSPLLLSVALKERGVKILTQSLNVWRYGIPATLIAQAGYALALTAYSLGNVGEIAALRETSILFASLLGYFWLKEPMPKRKAFALTIILVSAICLSII